MYHKKIFALFSLLVFLVFAAPLDAQILQSQTQFVQQTNLFSGGERGYYGNNYSGYGDNWCHIFNSNLRYGDSGQEVAHLQKAMQRQGFSCRSNSTDFDDYLASSVVGFQEKYRSEILAPWGLMHGTGYMGPATRAKLNQLYGCTANYGMMNYGNNNAYNMNSMGNFNPSGFSSYSSGIFNPNANSYSDNMRGGGFYGYSPGGYYPGY